MRIIAFNCYTGQSRIPANVATSCYSSGDCSGGRNAFTQLFNQMAGDINHCCFDGNLITPRVNPASLSFCVGGGTCRPCNRQFIYVIYNQLQLVIIAPAVSNITIANAPISVVLTLHFYMHAVCSFIRTQLYLTFLLLLLHGLALPVCTSEKLLVQYDSLHWASFDSCQQPGSAHKSDLIDSVQSPIQCWSNCCMHCQCMHTGSA